MSQYSEERFPVPLPGRLRRELHLPRPPWWLVLFVVLLILFGAIPLALILHSRTRLSEKPRIHLIQDMDVQPRHGPQATSRVFADGRAMRLPPQGTIARGALHDEPGFDLGYEIRGSGAQRELHFLELLPKSVRDDPRLLERGRERYMIFCAPCHGPQGDGQGPIHLRALSSREPKWVPPTDLRSESLRQRPDGYLYSAIRRGIRSMPPHAEQIPPRDRWAIVAWVRHLQRQNHAAQAATARDTESTP